jgi:hypothetical protein
MRRLLLLGTVLGLALLATPAIAQEMGTLVLEVDPDGSTVYVDGVRRGATPITPFGLPSGTHKLTVKHPHRLDIEGEVVIRAGAETHQKIELRKAARVTLDVQPKGAEIRVDGDTLGFAPVPPIELAPGKHEILVVHPTHDVGKRSVDLRAGEEREMKIVLLAAALAPGETVTVAQEKPVDKWYGPWAGVALGVGGILAGSGGTLVALDEDAAGYSLLGVGAASIITGVVLILAPEGEKGATAAVTPTVLPDGTGGGISFGGTF